MTTDYFFQAILDALDDEDIVLTQEQIDIIQLHCSKLSEDLEEA